MHSSTKLWAFGDKIVHTAKPEWGTGVVTAAHNSSHEGRPCQSLTIRFDRAGVKTISTAFAKLAAVESRPTLVEEEPVAVPAAAQAAPSLAPAASLAAKPGIAREVRESTQTLEPLVTRDPREMMSRLPEAATDPFSTPQARVKATLALYRFAPTGASLLDWAAAQSGLADPMSKFNRHELERFFQSYAVVRDNHLKKVVQELKKLDPASLAQLLTGVPPSVHQALRRLDALR